MAEIHLALEGSGAVEASEELVALPEIEGHWQRVDEGAVKDLAAVATVVTILGGLVAAGVGVTAAAKNSVEVAEKLYGWYQAWEKGRRGKRLEKVVMVVGRRRLEFRGATPQDIARVLEEL